MRGVVAPARAKAARARAREISLIKTSFHPIVLSRSVSGATSPSRDCGAPGVSLLSGYFRAGVGCCGGIAGRGRTFSAMPQATPPLVCCGRLLAHGSCLKVNCVSGEPLTADGSPQLASCRGVRRHHIECQTPFVQRLTGGSCGEARLAGAIASV